MFLNEHTLEKSWILFWLKLRFLTLSHSGGRIKSRLVSLFPRKLMLEMHFSFYLFSFSKMSLTWSTTSGLSSMMETISLSCCKQFLKYFGTKSYLSILAMKSLSSYLSLDPIYSFTFISSSSKSKACCLKYSFTFISSSSKSKACCKKAYRCFLVVISIKVDGFPFLKPDTYSFMLKFWYVFLKITTSLMGLFIKIKAPFSGI